MGEIAFSRENTSFFLPLFDLAFKKVADIVGDPSRTGIYCSIGEQNGLILTTFKVGEPRLEKVEKYHRCAGEKVIRLGQHPEHLTSSQSANESQDQYPGAFRTHPVINPNGKIISVSGFPYGEADVAVGLWAVWSWIPMDEEFAEQIANLDGTNQIWKELKRRNNR